MLTQSLAPVYNALAEVLAANNRQLREQLEKLEQLRKEKQDNEEVRNDRT